MPKETKMRSVTIEATFPELKIPRMYQQGRGTGSTVQAAMSAAVRDLLHQPKLKAQRYTMFTATVSVGTVPDEGKETSCENPSESVPSE
jgi:hypothetical protein